MPLVMSPKAKRFMNMPAVAAGFVSAVQQAEIDAAARATTMSAQMSRRFLSGRPLAPPRQGRATTGGALANYLQWQVTANGMIEFDLAGLEAVTPTSRGNFSYALIQEIGTGQSAQMLSTSGSAAITVPSQRGRRISPSLYWSDSDGGPLSRPLSRKNREAAQSAGLMGKEQLFLRPPGQFGRAGLIRREIKGKHFIQDGGVAGFTFLRDELLAQAQKAFG